MGLIGRFAATAAFRTLARTATAGIPRIFVFHNFCGPDAGVASKMDAGLFEWQMGQLSRDWHVITFGDYLGILRAGRRVPGRTVILTIDDGYRDFYEYAYPVLKRHGLPATFFVTTGFVGGELWLWPDKVEYALGRSRRTDVTVRLGERETNFPLRDTAERRQAWLRICGYCTRTSEDDKQRIIADLVGALAVDLPQAPSGEYGATSWAELREMADNGIEIGNHTISHPILSKVDRGRLQDEIGGAREILEEKLSRPVVSFCYPNSQPADINDEVVEVVRKTGHLGAVHWSGIPRRPDPFRVPRMGFAGNRREFQGKLHGVEFLNLLLRKT